MIKRFGYPVVCSLLFVAFASVRAATFYVSTTGSDAPGTTGADWANAFLTISNAVAHTTSGGADVIWVSNGVYEVDAEIAVVHDTTIIGLNGPENTFVRHDQSTGSRIFSLNHADAVLDGLTITNALTTATGDGGGVYIGASGGTVRNCHVVGNRSSAGTRNGLGIYAVSGLITNCLVAFNYTYHADLGRGPGVYLENGILVDSTVLGNRGREGAGVYITGAGARVRNCLIIGNRANFFGGGIAVNNPSGVIIENCTIANNQSYIWAGGVWHNVNQALYIRNCIIYEALAKPPATLRLTACVAGRFVR